MRGHRGRRQGNRPRRGREMSDLGGIERAMRPRGKETTHREGDVRGDVEREI